MCVCLCAFCESKRDVEIVFVCVCAFCERRRDVEIVCVRVFL